jgi:hypothetical protein
LCPVLVLCSLCSLFVAYWYGFQDTYVDNTLVLYIILFGRTTLFIRLNMKTTFFSLPKFTFSWKKFIFHLSREIQIFPFKINSWIINLIYTRKYKIFHHVI